MSDKVNQPTDNNSTEKSNSEIGYNEQIKKMLEESGIQSCDSQVVTHLSDYTNNYVTEVLNNAMTLAEHAGRKSVNTTDVKLAIEMVSKKSPSKRLPHKELIELAREHNQSQLPECSFVSSLPLPNEGHILTNCNYKLKSTTPQYPVNIPLMDMTNRQNQIVTLNAIKNHHAGSIPTVIRTSSGTMSVNMPLNLTPQRIILKPQTQFNNILSQNKNDDNIKKRLKLEEIRK